MPPFPGSGAAAGTGTTTTTTTSTGTAEPPVWAEVAAAHKGKLSLDFRGADVDNVLKFFSMASGMTIAKDPALKGPVTMISAKTLTLDEAFHILEAILNSKGYKLTKEGPVFRVIASGQSSSSGYQPSWSQFRDFMPRTDDQTPKPNEIRVYPLQHSDAQQVSRIINELFPQRGGFAAAMMAQRGGRFGGRFPGGFPGGAPGAPNTPQASLPDVHASADDYTNSVVVNANPDYMPQVEKLIQDLDKDVPTTMQTRVYPLQYATAQEMADVVSSVILSSAPGMRTSASQSLPFEQRVRGGGGGFAGSRTALTAVRTQVVPNDRTNSLIVTATPDVLDTVEKTIKDLDKPVEFQATTYVYPLQNAQAADVANLLSQAMRGGTGGYGSYSYGQRTTSSYRPSSSNRFGSRPTSGGSFSRAAQPGRGGMSRAPNPNELSVNPADAGRTPDDQVNPEDPDNPDADPAADATGAPKSRQYSPRFGGGGFFGGGYSSSASSAAAQITTGRDEQGGIVNLLNLAGQVTVVPDPNTNSLIINASPSNYAAIKDILTQLDMVPEQVLIEAVIAEATLDASNKLGIEWSWAQGKFFGSKATATTSLPDGDLASGPAFKFSVVGKQLNAALSALASDKKFNVLSTPRIFTANNRQAEINISQQVPYVLSVRQSETGVDTYNYGFLNVGIVLDVTPHISKNGLVNIEVNQQANELEGFTTFNAPLINQRSATTTISVRDGETIILGGIIRDTKNKTVNKVPVLGDIPVVGNLFKSHDVQTTKTELMVFLTPRVVKDADQASLLTNQQKSQLVNIVIPPAAPVAPNGKPGTPAPNPGAPGAGAPGNPGPGR